MICSVTGASGWIWDPDSWQEWAIRLLRQQYGADNVIKVPDQDRGDLGIECFTRSGVVYQCYCPENPDLGPRALYDNHRDKITKDINKFIRNKAELTRLFDSVKIRSWILFTPRHESHKTVQHCSEKATLVREAGLPYVTTDFIVDVHELADYKESAEILRRGPVLPAPLACRQRFPRRRLRVSIFVKSRVRLFLPWTRSCPAFLDSLIPRSVLLTGRTCWVVNWQVRVYWTATWKASPRYINRSLTAWLALKEDFCLLTDLVINRIKYSGQ